MQITNENLRDWYLSLDISINTEIYSFRITGINELLKRLVGIDKIIISSREPEDVRCVWKAESS